ncbi:hypothetical protein D3C84_605790 [compost metagenome]
MQLVLQEAADGIGQCHAVDQQDGENGEEIQQGDQGPGLDAEVLLDHFGDVRTFAPGQDETGQAAVGEKGHREGQHGQDQQRPEAADTGIDRQEQRARADGRTKQAEHPRGVLAVPGGNAGGARCARFARRYRIQALFNALGLVIHPVESPLAGH